MEFGLSNIFVAVDRGAPGEGLLRGGCSFRRCMGVAENVVTVQTSQGAPADAAVVLPSLGLPMRQAPGQLRRRVGAVVHGAGRAVVRWCRVILAASASGEVQTREVKGRNPYGSEEEVWEGVSGHPVQWHVQPPDMAQTLLTVNFFHHFF